MATSPQPPEPPPVSPSLMGQIWRWFKRLAVVLFVSWHLFAMLVRNPLDLWYKEIKGWAEKQPWWGEQASEDDKEKKKPWPTVGSTFKSIDWITESYDCFTGAEQGWTMFGSPLAGGVNFLTVQLEFTDDTTEEIRSENEYDPTSYFRVGLARVRKLEDGLSGTKADDIRSSSNRPTFEALVRWKLRAWRLRNPDDKREVKRILLVKRRITFPRPGEDPTHFEKATTTEYAEFDANGNLQ
jgi:hypothetical protein